MKIGEFISVSKRMVKEYFNRYVASSNGFQPIKKLDVKTIDFTDKEDRYDISFIVPYTDNSIYRVRYNKFTNMVDSIIYNNRFEKK